MHVKPQTSLIIGVWNRARYVASAIKSVLNQTRSDFELVVWDDGSTDDSLAVAREAARNDPRVRVVAGEHRGFPQSINSASRLLTAPYFGWVDSDDLLHESALKESAAILDAQPGVGMVYTDYLTIDETATVKGPGSRCTIPYSKDRLLVDFMTFHFRLMRRELFDRVGAVDESMRYVEDYDLCLKLSEITQIHHLQKPLYYYRVHRESVSKQQKLEQIENSARAIRAALARRKMDEAYELEVQYSAKFNLRRKAKK